MYKMSILTAYTIIIMFALYENGKQPRSGIDSLFIT